MHDTFVIDYNGKQHSSLSKNACECYTDLPSKEWQQGAATVPINTRSEHSVRGHFLACKCISVILTVIR